MYVASQANELDEYITRKLMSLMTAYDRMKLHALNDRVYLEQI